MRTWCGRSIPTRGTGPVSNPVSIARLSPSRLRSQQPLLCLVTDAADGPEQMPTRRRGVRSQNRCAAHDDSIRSQNMSDEVATRAPDPDSIWTAINFLTLISSGAHIRWICGPVDRRPRIAQPETEMPSATRMSNPSTASGGLAPWGGREPVGGIGSRPGSFAGPVEVPVPTSSAAT